RALGLAGSLWRNLIFMPSACWAALMSKSSFSHMTVSVVLPLFEPPPPEPSSTEAAQPDSAAAPSAAPERVRKRRLSRDAEGGRDMLDSLSCRESEEGGTAAGRSGLGNGRMPWVRRQG